MTSATLTYITTGIYWALILCWSAILYFYAKQYRWLKRVSPIVATLVAVIFVDAVRTLVESLYFGAWYTAKSGLLPALWENILEQPQYVLIPKGLNLLAALTIIGVLVRRWFRDVAAISVKHSTMEQYCDELEAAHAELKELEHLRDDLVHMIVHDMRTPLTSVIGSLQTALDGGLESPEARELVEYAIADAERVVGMTADLLDVNRLEQGQLSLDWADLDLQEIVAQSARTLALAAEEKGVHLRVETGDQPVPVRGDARLLYRVITNLAQNAIRHTPSNGEVALRTDLVRKGAEPLARIMVSDTGEGIPKEIQSRIFDKFFHATHDPGGSVTSTGLGLAFCRLAVEAHGGRIWVESEPGQGATFVVALRAQEKLPTAPESAGSATPP